MPGPIGSCPDTTSSPTIDEYLRAATGARPEASAARSEPSPAEREHAEHVEHGEHVAELLVEGGAEVAAEVTLATALASAGLAIGSAFLTWATAPFEAQRRGVEYDSEMMRGCLAAFEGRADDRDVRMHAAESPAFANGIRDAEAVAVRDPELFACVRAAVLSAGRAGEVAVFEGADAGPAFDARYESDLAFRHGVDRAREQREADPAAFDAAARAAGALTDAFLEARFTSSTRA